MVSDHSPKNISLHLNLKPGLRMLAAAIARIVKVVVRAISISSSISSGGSSSSGGGSSK